MLRIVKIFADPSYEMVITNFEAVNFLHEINYLAGSILSLLMNSAFK